MGDQGFYKAWRAGNHVSQRLPQLKQPGIGESYPVLAYTDDGLHILQFYHSGDQIGPDTVLIGPPRVLVTLDYATGDVLSTEVEPFNLPPFEDVEYTLTARERAVRRSEVERLQGLYDRLLETYPEPPDRKVSWEFVAALQSVVPPVLWPYYELLLRDLVPLSE